MHVHSQMLPRPSRRSGAALLLVLLLLLLVLLLVLLVLLLVLVLMLWLKAGQRATKCRIVHHLLKQ